ncbi:MAG: glycosyltransferase family 2 protein, partial [Lachnospiraceae bacterium]|nr:glycosyltransferase family 2 protein [Lachnospiraceae bacterium]
MRPTYDTNHTFAVCAYKDSPYLEECIRSLTEQEVPTNIILCTSTPSPYIQGLADQYEIPVYVREGKSDIQDDGNFAYD